MIGGIVAVIVALLAGVYALFQKNASLRRLLNDAKFKDEIRALADQLTKQEGKTKEDERDYSQAKDDFNRNNPSK